MTTFNIFKRRMARKILNFFITLFCGTAAANAGEGSGTSSILFIGNSDTHMNNMPAMFDEMCKAEGLNVHVEKSAQSGASFLIHSKRKEMYEAIASRKWDYIVLQGFSRELSLDKVQIDEETVPFLEQILDSINEHNEDAQVLLYMTWGYDNGFPAREEVNTFDKMSNSIAKGYSYLREKYDFPIVPVGGAWTVVKQDTTIDLYSDDRAHPSKNGSYLIASTFYHSLFSNASPHHNLGILDTLNEKIIHEKVRAYVDSNRTRFGLPYIEPEDEDLDDIEETKAAEYKKPINSEPRKKAVPIKRDWLSIIKMRANYFRFRPEEMNPDNSANSLYVAMNALIEPRRRNRSRESDVDLS